jgi:hypothetical protein
MSAKGLALAATVALLGLSLGGCVDGGPYYGAYAYSGYYGPAYYDPYYGPYYGGVIYGGYRDGYYRGHHRHHWDHHSGNPDGHHHRYGQDSNRSHVSYREGGNRPSYRGRPSYRSGESGVRVEHRDLKDNQHP